MSEGGSCVGDDMLDESWMGPVCVVQSCQFAVGAVSTDGTDSAVGVSVLTVGGAGVVGEAACQ